MRKSFKNSAFPIESSQTEPVEGKDTKLLFYPMAGPIEGQFDTLINILHAVEDDDGARRDLSEWIRKRFDLSESYAKKLCSVLIRGTGLVGDADNGSCLTPGGMSLLRSRSQQEFFKLLSRTFVGIEVLLRILGEIQPAQWEDLQAR